MINIASFDDFVAKKLKKDKRQEQKHEIFVEGLGKKLVLNTPSDKHQLEFMNNMGTGEDLAQITHSFAELIYFCCPTLQDKKLHENFGIVEPTDIMYKIFTIAEINEIGGNFADSIKLFDKANEVKNLSSVI